MRFLLSTAIMDWGAVLPTVLASSGQPPGDNRHVFAFRIKSRQGIVIYLTLGIDKAMQANERICVHVFAIQLSDFDKKNKSC